MDESKSQEFKDGDKVTLNYKQITSRKDWKRKLPNYKNWVNENKDKVFTVQKEKKYTEFVTLLEDNSEEKWMFWVGDLIKVEEEK